MSTNGTEAENTPQGLRLDKMKPEVLQIIASKLRRRDVVSLYASCSAIKHAVVGQVFEDLALQLPLNKVNAELLASASKVKRLHVRRGTQLPPDSKVTTETFLSMAHALLPCMDNLEELDLQRLDIQPQAIGELHNVIL